jgi:hypothetical protein
VPQRSIKILIGRLITDNAFRSVFLMNCAHAFLGFLNGRYEWAVLEMRAVLTFQALCNGGAARSDTRVQSAQLHDKGGSV